MSNSSNNRNSQQPYPQNSRWFQHRHHGARDVIDRIVDFISPPRTSRSTTSASSTSSASSNSDIDLSEESICAICSRREHKVLFTICGHRACRSCTKRLWNSTANINPRLLNQYNPRPTSFPCPFCRGEVVWVRVHRATGVEEGEEVTIVDWVLSVSKRARARLSADMRGHVSEELQSSNEGASRPLGHSRAGSYGAGASRGFGDR